MGKLIINYLNSFSLNNRRIHAYIIRYGFILILIIYGTNLFAQNARNVQGIVVDSDQSPIIGAAVYLKGTTIGTVTDVDGKFSLAIPSTEEHIIIVSYVGMLSEEISIADQDYLEIVLVEDILQLEDVVVIGYGVQKKASLVGSISQTSGKDLERSGGVSSVGAALAGKLPGVITYSSTGMPGAEDPKIVIRSISSWNNSEPLILVDGVERPMSTVDISSIQNISVLKDASATAVYGVKGANGVILITTKRGKQGKAQVQVRTNTTAKVVSKLPEKYDSYDSYMLRNTTIERELGISPKGWLDYTPKEIIEKFRNPANTEELDRYPNIDWEDELFKGYAMSYNTSVNVLGGTEFVNYFSSIDYLNEGDLFKEFENGRGYNSGYGFNRINIRTNLDINLTKSTLFSANLFGSRGVRKVPYLARDDDAIFWSSAYLTAPDAMHPIYSDGTWGFYAPRDVDVPNSVERLATSGVEKKTTTNITTDFILTQKLDALLKGLSVKANLSIDNTFRNTGHGINDYYNYAQRKWVNTESGEVVYAEKINQGTQLDYSENISWTAVGGSLDRNSIYRKLYYFGQLNYDRIFGKHIVTGMGLFSRETWARGSMFNIYREDWVFRATYNYASKYLAEVNGAYNGSEKFGPGYRFDFFPSFSAGWMISEESFMQKIGFLGMLKFRGSWGRVGDDAAGDRFLYKDIWAYGGNAQMGDIPSNTPYTFYLIDRLGNPDISWEISEKRNLGIDYSFFSGFMAGSFDMFNDHRSRILIVGNDRAVPSYFGADAPTGNLGEVKSNGYEFELRLNHVFANQLRLWANTNFTHAKNEIIFSDDPEFSPDYQKSEGYAIGQTRAYLDYGFIESWDDVYGSTQRISDNLNKIAGDFNIIDINGDGVIDTYDRAPYQYSGVPQNTYSSTFGMEWKGFACFVQFYGVSNVTREVTFPTFRVASNVAYVEGTYWNKYDGGENPYPRWTTTLGEDAAGTRYLYDGSYLRLKNLEISYSFNYSKINALGMESCRLYLNGDNLLLWTEMPDDRESNFSGNSSNGAYPTARRFNLGIDIIF